MNERNVVVLVDEQGQISGTETKLAAHEAGLLHLAFSVVLYGGDGRILLQQRAPGKYHFPSMWANACCSHPGPGEDIRSSAELRVTEELGIEVDLAEAGTFVYEAVCPSSGLIEHELDHVFLGMSDAPTTVDPEEVAAICWVDPSTVLNGELDLAITPWLVDTVRLAEAMRGAGSSQR